MDVSENHVARQFAIRRGFNILLLSNSFNIYRLEMTEILLKGRKTLTHPSSFNI